MEIYQMRNQYSYNTLQKINSSKYVSMMNDVLSQI